MITKRGVFVPIYEYQCSNCKHQFDVMQKFSDEPVKQCPECGENTVVKWVSAAGFQLKGTGWYATDFKDKKTKPEVKNDSAKSAPVEKKTPGDAT